MAAGISLSIGADTRDFASGVKKGLVEPLEDTQKVLDDVARAGDDATSKLEAGFRDQQRASAENAREYKAMSNDIRQASRRTTSDVGQDSRQMARESSEAVDEIHESLRSNAIETAASFDGSFEGITGGLQGLLSEFLIGFGPAGIVAGLVAASGLGLLTTAIEGGTEAAEEQKAAVSDLGAEYIEAGRTGRREFSAVADSITAMATSTGDDVAITLQKAYDAAKKSGADYQEVVETIAQASPAELDRVITKIKAIQQGHIDSADAAKLQGRFTEGALNDGSGAAGILITALEKTRDVSAEAARAQRLAAKAGLSDFQLKADLLGQLEGRYDDAAAGADHFNKKTGEFDVADFLADMKKVRSELKKYQADLAAADLSPEAKKFLEKQGADSAAAMLRGYKNASPRQKAELNEVWSTAGVENASNYEDAIGKKLSTVTVNAPKVSKPVIPAPDARALDAYLARPAVKRVILDVVTRSGQKVP